MTDCPSIYIEKVRAKIVIAGSTFVTTGTDPSAAGDIMSFSITKSRGQPIATMRCSLSVWHEANVLQSTHVDKNHLGPQIVVYGGANGSMPKLFTGYVTHISTDPHWEDTRKFILNISAEDEFAKMKYGGKFSRRFKQGDDAYAVITDGKRREGGRMTRLRRTPAGKKGVDGPDSGSADPNNAEHSPLVKTPDPQGLSPNASKPGSKSKGDTQYAQVRFEPSHVYANSGDTVFAKVVDAVTGEELDPNVLKNTVGTKCLLCMSPPPAAFDTGVSSNAQGMDPDKKTFPISVKYGSETDSTAKGFTFTVTADYPAKITFIHPLTAGTCTINFHQTPVHSHITMAQGGPAVATFDVAQY